MVNRADLPFVDDDLPCPQCRKPEGDCTCDVCPECELPVVRCMCEDEELLCEECDMPESECICDQEEPVCGICGEPLRENCDCEPSDAYGDP